MYADEHQIHAITPLAEQHFRTFTGEHLVSMMDNFFKLVFDNPNYLNLTNDAQGRVLEKYILVQMEKQRRFKAKLYIVDNSIAKENWNTYILDITHLSVKHFKTTKPYYFTNVDLNNQSILAIPVSPNYPGIDAAIWDCKTQTLYPISMTISKQHSQNFDYNLWGDSIRQKLQKSNDWTPNINFVWIRTTSTGMSNQDRFVMLNDLDSIVFPLINYWK